MRRISRSLSRLPVALELILQLDRTVEVILDGALVAAGDDQDVVDAAFAGLLDHVLDHRLVDDRQHLFWLRLGCREEPGAKTCCGDDCFHARAFRFLSGRADADAGTKAE